MQDLIYIAKSDYNSMLNIKCLIFKYKQQLDSRKDEYNTMCDNVSEAYNMYHLTALLCTDANYRYNFTVGDCELSLRSQTLNTRELLYSIYQDACSNRNIIANSIIEVENKLFDANTKAVYIKKCASSSRKKAVKRIVEDTITVDVLSDIIVSYLQQSG